MGFVPKTSWVRLTIANEGTNTAAIDIIQLRVDNQKPVQVKKIFERLQGVVLQVLMADIPKIVLFEHEWQIAHLHDPDTVGIHDSLYVSNEFPRLLQVIEHSNRCDHFRT